MSAPDAVPPEAYVVALAGLPDMGPAALRALLEGRSAEEAWRAMVGGRLTGRGAARQAVAAAGVDVEAVWQAHRAAGVGVAVFGAAGYPAAFLDDPDPPSVVFSSGDPSAASGPRVAIVGTRSATRYGLDIAFELGAGLAAAGVSVVSGLALGIDGAAHAGTVEVHTQEGAAPPIAVVAGGLDVIYPRGHQALWTWVATRGLVLSEVPLGVRPTKWRFPARNRLIAALADIVVVVESGEVGGSMHTVDEAIRRDRPVMAVPGPIRSHASAGTNRLLGECATPVGGVDDVLLALGLTPGVRRCGDARPVPSTAGKAVLDAIGWEPTLLDALLLRTGLAIGDLLTVLDELVVAGWVAERGGWYERVARATR